MTDEVPLTRRATDAIADWETEAKLWEGWRDLPEIFRMARRRLPQLMELEAPGLVIEGEIALVRKRIEQMRELRQKWMH